jgi:hypothetical protein
VCFGCVLRGVNLFHDKSITYGPANEP